MKGKITLAALISIILVLSQISKAEQYRLIPEKLLNTGNKWTYNFEASGTDDDCEDFEERGTTYWEVLGSRIVEGYPAKEVELYTKLKGSGYEKEILCWHISSDHNLAEVSWEYSNSDGDWERETVNNNNPHIILPIFIDDSDNHRFLGRGENLVEEKDGHMYTSCQDEWVTYVGHERIQVPAGTFDCIVVHTESKAYEPCEDDEEAYWYTRDFWFSPTIGIIKVQGEDGDDSCELYEWSMELTSHNIIENTIKKCLVKAGKTDNKDMILVLGQIDATEDDLYDANDIQVTISSDDMNDPNVASFPIDEQSWKNSKYNYARTENASKMQFKLDTKNGKFLFMAKNIDLTGLSCPVSMKIEIDDYVVEAQIDEDIVNGPKKLIPIQFMMGVKDILRVDKAKVKLGKKPSTDSLSIKGAFTVEDVQAFQNGFNNGDPIVVTLGSQNFTIPGAQFYEKGNAWLCRNVDIDSSFASAKFDFAKCTFIINIKKTSITDYGLVDFGIEFFGTNILNEEKIDLGERRSYGLEELRRYDALGAWWDYHGDYTIKGIGLNEQGSADATISVSSFTKWVNGHECSVVNASSEGVNMSSCWYTDANGTHQMGWGSVAELGGFEMTMDSVMVAPTVLRIGQQHTDSGSFEGTYDIDSPYIDVDWFRGQVRSTYKLVGHEQVSVPAGTFEAVKCETKLEVIGQMYIRYDDSYEQFEGIVKFNAVINQTWWGVPEPEVGIVKSITSMTIKMGAKGMGSASVKITETDVLTDYGD